MVRVKKFLASIVIGSVLIGSSLTSVGAATSDSWNIKYIKGAPTSVSNQTDIIRLPYYSGGYYANCSSISGTNGRALSITSSSAGGMKTVSITTTGRTARWMMNGSTTGSCSFTVKASYNYSCSSTGTISIYQ